MRQPIPALPGIELLAVEHGIAETIDGIDARTTQLLSKPANSRQEDLPHIFSKAYTGWPFGWLPT
jgi:hypothetical protein